MRRGQKNLGVVAVRDVVADWKRWTRLERVVAVTLTALIGAMMPVIVAATVAVSP